MILGLRLSILLILLPGIVLAQSAKQTVTVSITKKTVTAMLADLFADSGRSYVVDPRVKDANVPPISIDGAPFDVALRCILRSVGLTFDAREGVYHILNVQRQGVSSAPQKLSGTKRIPPTFTVTQNTVTAPLGVRLVFSGTLAAKSKSTQFVTAQLRVNNVTLCTSSVDTNDAYELRLETMQPLSGTFRIMGVMADGSTLAGKRGAIDIYGDSAAVASPMAISGVEMKGFAKASLQLSGRCKSKVTAIVVHPDHLPILNKTIAVRGGAVSDSGAFEFDLSDSTITNYAIWPVVSTSDELCVGPSFTFRVPEYIRIVEPAAGSDWLVADTPSGQPVNLEAKDIDRSEVSIIVDGSVLGVGTVTESRFSVKVDDSSLTSGVHMLWAVAKSAGMSVATLPISLIVRNPKQDARDAEIAAQHAAQLERQRQYAEAIRQAEEARLAVARAAVMEKFYSLPLWRQDSIYRQYLSEIISWSMHQNVNGSLTVPDLAEYLIIRKILR